MGTAPFSLCEAVAGRGEGVAIRPNLTTLRMFLSAYMLGNLSKAAEREHIVPSAIGKRLQDLENEVGAPLFCRHARGQVRIHAHSSSVVQYLPSQIASFVHGGVVMACGGNLDMRAVPLDHSWARRSLVICIRDEEKLTAGAADAAPPAGRGRRRQLSENEFPRSKSIMAATVAIS
jgi:hypothetical protein